MIKRNYIHVSIPQQFNFELLGIADDKIYEFLTYMCSTSINKPIIKDGNAIGYIQSSVINENGNGIVSKGFVWCNVENELFRNENNKSYSFDSITID